MRAAENPALERAKRTQRLIDESRADAIPVGEVRELTPQEVRDLWPDWEDTIIDPS